MAQLAERLLSMHAASGSIPSAIYIGMMAQVCCPSTREVKGETRVWGQLQIHETLPQNQAVFTLAA